MNSVLRNSTVVDMGTLKLVLHSQTFFRDVVGPQNERGGEMRWRKRLKVA